MNEEIEKYYAEHYQNEKERSGINVNRQLKIDFQIFCAELSRKAKKTITASSRLRLLMVEDMLRNKKNKTNKLF